MCACGPAGVETVTIIIHITAATDMANTNIHDYRRRQHTRTKAPAVTCGSFTWMALAIGSPSPLPGVRRVGHERMNAALLVVMLTDHNHHNNGLLV